MMNSIEKKDVSVLDTYFDPNFTWSLGLRNFGKELNLEDYKRYLTNSVTGIPNLKFVLSNGITQDGCEVWVSGHMSGKTSGAYPLLPIPLEKASTHTKIQFFHLFYINNNKIIRLIDLQNDYSFVKTV